MNIQQYWQDVANQDAEALVSYFMEDAVIYWHNTNEAFTVSEFIQANCKYPGAWQGIIERQETLNDLLITVVKIIETTENISFHVTSFFKLKNDKIVSLDEYWGDDGNPPDWRQGLHLGKSIL